MYTYNVYSTDAYSCVCTGAMYVLYAYAYSIYRLCTCIDYIHAMPRVCIASIPACGW